MNERQPFSGEQSLYRQEELFAREISSSSTPVEIARQYLGLPEDTAGLTIVDVASGLSSMTAGLLAEGADSYAVDPLYTTLGQNLDEVVDSVHKNTMGHVPWQFREAMGQTLLQSLEAFRASFTAQPDRYKPGFASRLPFPDDFADFVTSLNGLSGMIEYPEIILAGVFEALRVAKPGGRVVLCPWYAEDGYSDSVVEVHEQVEEQIRRSGLGLVVLEPSTLIHTPIPLTPQARLSIVKH